MLFKDIKRILEFKMNEHTIFLTSTETFGSRVAVLFLELNTPNWYNIKTHSLQLNDVVNEDIALIKNDMFDTLIVEWKLDSDKIDDIFNKRLLTHLYNKYQLIKKEVYLEEPGTDWYNFDAKTIMHILAAYNRGIKLTLESEIGEAEKIGLNRDYSLFMEILNKYFSKPGSKIYQFGNKEIVTFVKEVLNYANTK